MGAVVVVVCLLSVLCFILVPRRAAYLRQILYCYVPNYASAACGQLGLLQLGKSIHSKIVEYGLECGVVVANCLIGMYGKCGLLEDAIFVFNKMVDKDIIYRNSVIAARNHDLEQAFRFFHQLSDPYTISYNELINGIARFGNMKEAIEILSIMPKPNSSSWNSILTGYVHRNRAHEALKFLDLCICILFIVEQIFIL
ncbi:hypothetical protein QYF36_001631 [Acer negundo]|nr:hypothetical protein QYF36_001631 [Acer negundo]